MSSGSQFLDGTGGAASDFSLLFRRVLTLAGLCTQFRFRRPPSGVDCARDGRDLSRRGAPLMGTLFSVPAVTVSSGASITFRFRHRSRTNPVSMHEDGRDPLAPGADAPRPQPHSPRVPGCPYATALTSGFARAWPESKRTGRGLKVWCRHLLELM